MGEVATRRGDQRHSLANMNGRLGRQNQERIEWPDNTTVQMRSGKKGRRKKADREARVVIVGSTNILSRGLSTRKKKKRDYADPYEKLALIDEKRRGCQSRE